MASGPLADKANVAKLEKCVRVKLDVTDEKQRDWTTRYAPNELPTLVYLSSRGAIVKRTEGVVPADELGKILDTLIAESPKVDAELAKLEAARDAAPTATAPQEALADFWLARQNWNEAVPALERLVRAKGDGVLAEDKRLARWGQLARALATLGRFDDCVREAEALARAADAAHDTGSVQTAWLLVAFSRESQERFDDAVKAYGQCVAAGADTPLGRRAAQAKQALEQRK